MKSVSAFSVLAIALMLLSGTSFSPQQVDSGIVIDWEEQTSAEATPDQGEEFLLICCVDDLTHICDYGTGAGGCPPGTTEISCPCPWTSERP